MINTDFMKSAIYIAKQSENDIPVGAVMICNGEIIAQSCNKKEQQQMATKHAEMIVIEEACQKLNSWRLENCELYVTLEPCPMCAWALLQSRLKAVYFGAYDQLYGALGSKLDLKKLSNSKTKVTGGILETECNELLKQYFEKMRNDNKK